MTMVSENPASDRSSSDHAALAESMPLDEIDVSHPSLYQQDVWQPYFRRLRREAPVHYCRESALGPYWSITKHKDIIAAEVNHAAFSSSSTLGGITLRDRPGELELPMFIAMDPPKHNVQRKVVQPIVAPENLANFESLIRARVRDTLDHLPRGETFNWVDKVSTELTCQMLATLFDFPFEDRRKLSYWSDVSTAVPYEGGLIESEDQREEVFRECLGYFMRLWNERVNAEPRPDLISMLAHGEATRDMSAREYLGNVVLLIVGGNDTTRNSMSGGLLFLSQNPDEFAKLRARPELVESMAPEIIRYQTPLAYMRRTAVADVEFGGQADPQGRQGRDVVHFRKPRRGGDRRSRPVHHRPRPSAPASVVRFRHSPLRRQEPGRNAIEDPVAGNSRTPAGDRGRRRAETGVFGLRPRNQRIAGAHSGLAACDCAVCFPPFSSGAYFSACAGMTPVANATAAAWVKFMQCSLWRAASRWVFTLPNARPRISAISW